MSATPELATPWRIGPLTIPNRVVLAPLAGIGNWFVRLQAKRSAGAGGPVSIQLFGQDPDVMRSAAATVAELGADLIDLNMGCPVPKVTKTGAGVALLSDPDTAVAVARAAHEGAGLPVTVKLRAGRRVGEAEGLDVA